MTRFLPLLAAVLVLTLPGAALAQTQIYQEAFETDGNPARYTTSVPEAITSGTSSSDFLRNYFTRTDGTQINQSQVQFVGAEGFFFAAQDVDDATGTNPVSLTIPNIDISAVSAGLQLRATYAEDDQTSGGAPVEAWDASDYVKLYASIDGGAEVLILAFESSSSTETNTAPRVDTDFDGIGDGIELTPTFSEITASIAGTGSSLTLRYEFDLNGDNEDIAIDNISVFGIVGTGQIARVAFSSAGTPEIAEDGGSATVDVVLTTSDGARVDDDVTGTVDVTVGTNDGDVVVTNGTFSFLAGSTGDGSVTQTVTVTATDDMTFEGTESFELGFATLDGALPGDPATFAFSVLDDDPPPPAPPVRISEVDARTAELDDSGDDVEFIELIGPPNYPLDGLVIVLLDGADGLANNDFDLDDCSTDANGVFVIGDEAVVGTTTQCNAGVPLTRALFNGCANCNKLADGPDAVLLFEGNGGDFENNDDIAVAAAAAGARLFDAYAWGVNKSRQTAAMLDVIDSFPGFENTVQHDEAYTGDDPETQSMSRIVISGEATVVGGLFYPGTPTPGALNPASITVDLLDGSSLYNPSTAEDDGADWRLLSVPLFRADAEPFAVGNLASRNLVQGVAAGSVFPAEYAGAAPNLYTAYTGTSGDPSGYAAPATTDAELAPGDGFWWYWYDNNLVPTAGGTSRSYELTPTADGGLFDYAFTGIPVDDVLSEVLAEPIEQAIAVYSDGGASRFGLAGNPFAYPYRLGGVSADAGTLSTTFQAYEPGSGYVPLLADTASPYDGAALGVGEGVFFEVSDVAEGQTVTLSSPSAFVDPTTTDDFNGRHAAAGDVLALRLSGTLADGTEVTDRAAIVRWDADATDGWDRHDASKLLPLNPARALLAPVGQRDGAPYRQAVVSQAAGADSELALAFSATQAGTYRLSADVLPGAENVSLRDEATGEVVDLRAGPYTFDAAASGWTDRFTLAVGGVLVASEPDAVRVSELSAPAPNPARRASELTLTTASAGTVRAVLIDALGRTVATLHDGPMAASGSLTLRVEAGDFAPGIYTVRVTGEELALSRRITLLK